MKAMLLSLLFLGAAPSGPAPSSLPPEALGAPPLVDASPTAWSCTIDTLRAGKECVFEAEVPPPGAANADQEAANVRLLKDASRALCSEAVSNARDGTPDPKLVAVCERKYADVVGRCGIDGNSPVVDGKGRFAPAARACYRALSTVLQDVQLMASVASTCCECAARSQCPGTGESCYAAVSRQQAGPTTLACMDDRCHDACSMMLPPSASIPRQTPSRGSEQNAGSAAL
ncbi:hypothetical protein [Corallococcus aberystwythensis]|uniref:Uncharacterized protein n=1 Tax=Corallococcus aberystwythensis TaxID=2316722 RepID=A0A3A8Q9X9_9BACT|nr:hypothetical protein [Corallococcus aberystwythensis]RKH65483.1 hypothetical protein D7W81_16910 [Corallococcus aberystwythensis]